MTIKKIAYNKWHVDIKPEGRKGKRYRKTFASNKEAKAFVKEVTDNPKKYSSNMTLSELVEFWYGDEGIDKKDGKARKRKLERMVEELGDCKANELTKSKLKAYRRKVAARNSNATANRLFAYLRCCYRYAISENKYNGIDPTVRVKALKEDNNFKNYLNNKQLKSLLIECNNSRSPRLIHVVSICLATGSRWGETISLKANDFQDGKIIFNHTKNDNEKKIPIPADLYQTLTSLTPRADGRLFPNCSEAFKNAIKRACIVLPKGQLTHVLRHSFASHFLKNGGTLANLNKILDHSTYEMTLRYSHLCDEDMETAIQLNPLTHG